MKEFYKNTATIEMKDYEKSIADWNEAYAEAKLTDLTDKTLSVEPLFDMCLNIFALECPRILDYGCGTGDNLFQCAQYKNLTYGLGIDLSQTGIQYAREMASYNHYSQLNFEMGDIDLLSQYEEGDFDGIILSNVLDVMPREVAVRIFCELTRLLKRGGLMFVKLNPYYDEKVLEEFGLTKLKDNLYEEDGVLKLREVDTAAWHRAFEKGYTILRYLEFPYPWQDGMNRLFLLKKD